MAYKNSKTKSKRNKKKVSRSKRLTQLAYEMGQVQKGLKNPDSMISESFKAGEKSQKRVKKSLF